MRFSIYLIFSVVITLTLITGCSQSKHLSHFIAPPQQGTVIVGINSLKDVSHLQLKQIGHREIRVLERLPEARHHALNTDGTRYYVGQVPPGDYFLYSFKYQDAPSKVLTVVLGQQAIHLAVEKGKVTYPGNYGIQYSSGLIPPERTYLGANYDVVKALLKTSLHKLVETAHTRKSAETFLSASGS